MDGAHDTRLMLSREALRAELAEMELRLRIWIAQELSGKADHEELLALRSEFTDKAAEWDSLKATRDRMTAEHDEMMKAWRASLEGRFTPAQDAAMLLRAKQVIVAADAAGWSKRERVIATAAVLVSVLVAVINVSVTLGVGQ